jgi:hypothetical protein
VKRRRALSSARPGEDFGKPPLGFNPVREKGLVRKKKAEDATIHWVKQRIDGISQSLKRC